MNRDHGSPESILAERGILISAILINPLQFLQEFAAQHTFSLPWIKTIFCPLFFWFSSITRRNSFIWQSNISLLESPAVLSNNSRICRSISMMPFFGCSALRAGWRTGRSSADFFSKASCNCSALTKPYGQARHPSLRHTPRRFSSKKSEGWNVCNL